MSLPGAHRNPTSAESVPKLNLRKLRSPRIEDARQPEDGRLEWVALDVVPSGIADEEQAPLKMKLGEKTWE